MNHNLTVPRAARLYNVSEAEIQQAIDKGELQLHPLRIWRLFDRDVQAWMRTKSEPRK